MKDRFEVVYKETHSAGLGKCTVNGLLTYPCICVISNIPIVCMNLMMKWGLIWREINIRRRHIN